MKDELITYDIAMLAAAKGFDEVVEHAYFDVDGETVLDISDHNNSDDLDISAPSQSLLQRWLREKHNLHIEVKVKDYVVAPMYYWSIFGQHGTMTTIRCLENSGEVIDERFNSEEFPSYEEALENALLEALIRIKDEM